MNCVPWNCVSVAAFALIPEIRSCGAAMLVSLPDRRRQASVGIIQLDTKRLCAKLAVLAAAAKTRITAVVKDALTVVCICRPQGGDRVQMRGVRASLTATSVPPLLPSPQGGSIHT